MKLTNKRNLPETIVNVLKRPQYSKGKANLSVTELINSPRIVQLKRLHWDQLEEDASSMVWSLFGSAVHNILQHGKDEHHIVEQRLFADIEGWTISGAIDLQIVEEDGVVISDYKSGGKDDDEGNAIRARDALQLQIYALAWRAATGRLPDEVSLRSLDSGKAATVPVDPKRIVKARERILEAAEGIQSGSMEAKPDLMNCTYCSYRELCPSSKAPAGRPA